MGYPFENGERYRDGKPFFSIGVTTYDRVSMLAKTLSSILAQTFEDFEVIVGNDNTDRVVNAETIGIGDKRIRYINHENNMGCLQNMNSLLEKSTGKYFTWLSDDDMLFPIFLERIHLAINSFRSLECLFTSYFQGEVYPDDVNISNNQPMLFSGSEWLTKYLNRDVKTQGCYGMFKKQYLQQRGGIHQMGKSWFSPYCDNLLAIEAGLLNKVVYIPDPLFFYRVHEGSISAVSGDVDAYSSAQKDLIPKSINVFKSNGLRDDFNSNLYSLLQWCMKDYFTVMRRSGKLQWKKLIGYLVFFFRYIARLRDYRYRMIVITIHNTFNLIKYFINRDISRIQKAVVRCKLRI